MKKKFTRRVAWFDTPSVIETTIVFASHGNMLDVLQFLQREYETLDQLNPAEKEAVRRKNAFVRETLESKRIYVPLRTLHIDLKMHQQCLQDHKTADDTVKEKLLADILCLKMFIREQTDMGEKVVPDPNVEQVVRECRFNPEKLINALTQWIPESRRELFRNKIMFEWSKGNPRWMEKVIAVATKEFSELSDRNAEMFRDFFCMIECIQNVEL